MQSSAVAPSPSPPASGIRLFKWTDLVYAAVALWGAWYGTGDMVFMILASMGLLLLSPLFGLLSCSFARGWVMVLLTIVLMFGIGWLWKKTIVHYGKRIPAQAMPLIEKYRRDHGVTPERIEDIPGMPWIPPLFQCKIEDESISFSILSNFDYWHNWKYVEDKNRQWHWVHFSM